MAHNATTINENEVPWRYAVSPIDLSRSFAISRMTTRICKLMKTILRNGSEEVLP
jgi:hypothetical protein